MGVVVGPLSSTSQAMISASTSSGTAWLQASRFSIVRPRMRRRAMLPRAISSASSASSTRTACSMIMGPMPSPSTRPMVTVALFV